MKRRDSLKVQGATPFSFFLLIAELIPLLNDVSNTACKVSKYGVISGPYFRAFKLNTGKYRPEITPYLDTFHAVKVFILVIIFWKIYSVLVIMSKIL